MLIDDFKLRFVEFSNPKYDDQISILADVWPSYYGGSYDTDQEAILNLVAHLLVGEIQNGSASVKGVQAQSVGSVSLSFAATSASNSERTDWYRTTKYGQRFLMLTRARSGGVFV